MSKKVIANEQVAEKSKKEKKTGETYESIPGLVKLVNSVKNTGISVPNLINLIKLKAELKELLQEYNLALKTVLEDKHGLKKENDGYAWVEHPNAEEIQADVIALNGQSVKIKAKLNFLSYKELSAATQDLNIAIISEIADKLAANE